MDETPYDNEGGPIRPGSPEGMRFGFTADRFTDNSYLWRERDAVIVSFVACKRPRRGDFRQLVEKVQAAGLAVEIPTPMGRMLELVQRHGYRKEIRPWEEVGSDVEVWRLEPPVVAENHRTLSGGQA